MYVYVQLEFISVIYGVQLQASKQQNLIKSLQSIANYERLSAQRSQNCTTN